MRSPRALYWAARRRLQPDHRVRVRLDGNVSLRVRLGDEISLPFVLRTGFEPDVSAFLRSALRPGMTFVDVGANIGQFTVQAAAAVGPAGSVHAFEPAPAPFRQLLANVAGNGFENVVAVESAVSDYVGEATLRLAEPGRDLYNSLGTPLSGSTCREQTVACTTLDAHVEAHELRRVDVVKIDVEGAEMQVIGGAGATLRQYAPTLICEFSDLTAKTMGHSTAELRTALESLGYTLHRYDPATGSLEPEPWRDAYEYANLICTAA